MDLITDVKGGLQEIISDELISMGISPVRLGYTYLSAAVMEVISDEKLLMGITKSLYPQLASFFCTSAQAVERAIRAAISEACNTGNENLRRFIGMGKDCNLHFTNKEFIFKTVNHIKRQTEIGNNDEY